MKRYYYKVIMAALAAILLVSCEDDYVHIDTLQVFGDIFYQGQDVMLGLAVDTNDPFNNYYEWWCEEGSFPSLQQGLPMNRWTAPRKNGEFLIRCTVTCGSAKEIREAKVKVNGLFFDRFTGTALNAWTTTDQIFALNNGRLETHLNTTVAAESGAVSKTLNIADFNPPMSVTATVGIVGVSSVPPSMFDPVYPVDAPTSPIEALKWDNSMSVELSGSTPAVSIAPNYYISNIALKWWPAEHIQPSVKYVGYGSTDTVTINATDFDASLTVTLVTRADASQGRPQSAQTFSVFFKSDALKSGPEQAKNVGISIAADNTVSVVVNKQQVFTTTALAAFRPLIENAPFMLDQFIYRYPFSTQAFLDDVLLNNEATPIYFD
jgi:hypothetical protein